MEYSDNERSIKNIISSMKLSYLKKMAKVLGINVIGCKKENYIESIASYVKHNIYVIMSDFVTYEEYELIKKLCDENYTIALNKKKMIKEEIIKSLEYLGILYVYCDCNQKNISIPVDIRESLKSIIYHVDYIDNYKANQKLRDMFRELLDIYGVMPQELLVDYIIQDVRWKYRIHEALRILVIYNFRYNLYYCDRELKYYNIKILNLKALNEKLINKLDLNYKYYDQNRLKTINNRKSNYIEKEICVVLKRQFKSSEIVLEYLDYIRIMIKNDMSSEEISEIIRSRTKRMSQQGRKILEGLIDRVRVYYPLWTLKGYSLEDLQCNKMINDM